MIPSTVSETRVETASESDIDSQLASLTRRTSLEELARAGKTRNLKTLSERNLKEWIKEALRRVITSSATTLGAEEQERLLAHTREELTAIMSERKQEADTRAADAERLATVSAERDALAMRLANLEASHADRINEWERRATEAAQRRDALAARNAELEARVKGAERQAEAALEAPLVDDEVLASLRAELAAERERGLALEAERTQLQRTISKRLVASAEVVAGVLALDRRVYRGAHHAGAMESSADPEAAFFADEQAAQAVIAELSTDLDHLHGQLVDKVPEIADDDGTLASDLRRLDELEWMRVQDSLIDDLQDQLAAAQASLATATVPPPAATVDADEMAQMRGRCGELQSKVHHLTAELTEAKRTAALAREAVARLLREQDKHQVETGTITQRITAAERRQADVDRRQAEVKARAETMERQNQELRAALAAAQRQVEAGERDHAETRGAATAARQAAEAARQAAEAARNAAIERERRQAQDNEVLRARAAQADAALAERDQLRRALAQAERARDGLARDLDRARAAPTPVVAAPAASAPAVAEPTDVVALRDALARARSVVTDAEGVPHEDVAGMITATRKGGWLTTWADRKGRLRLARTVGDRWVTCGRVADVPPITGVAGQPLVVIRGESGQLLWHDAQGSIHTAPVDRNGRQLAAPTSVGTSPHVPALARGGGSAPQFLIRVDEAGHLHLHDEGQPPRDLTALVAAPPAVGPASAWLWSLEGSRHCAYRAADGGIHELLELQGTWFHADLSGQTGAPPAAADPLGYAPADHEHVIYLGADGHVHELCFDSERWIHHDLTAASGAPAASGRPGGGYLGGRHSVVHRGVDGAVHLLRLRRDWRHTVLSDCGLVAGDPQVAASGEHGAITFATVAGVRRWARLAADGSVQSVGELPG